MLTATLPLPFPMPQPPAYGELDNVDGPTDAELEEIEADGLEIELPLEPEPGEDLVSVNIWPRLPGVAGRW
jgi:hypothetical protein